MVYRERGCRWYLECLECYHSPRLALNGYCYILVGLGWSLLFPCGLWIDAVISWWVLDACCYFLVGPGRLLLFPAVSWMVTVFSLWAMDGYRYFSTTQILAPCAHRACTVPSTPSVGAWVGQKVESPRRAHATCMPRQVLPKGAKIRVRVFADIQNFGIPTKEIQYPTFTLILEAQNDAPTPPPPPGTLPPPCPGTSNV